MQLQIISGNILGIENDGVICHQVNCKRKAGAGLALQIRQKYPNWYLHFLDRVPHLGMVDIYEVCQNLYIASLYSQIGYGRGLQTDYWAMRVCLQYLNHISHTLPHIYMPVGIGCGLGGGNWDTVYSIIEEELPYAILVERR